MGTALPAALEAHFTQQATIGLSRLAELLPMDPKTLARHIAAGHLVGRQKESAARSPAVSTCRPMSPPSSRRCRGRIRRRRIPRPNHVDLPE